MKSDQKIQLMGRLTGEQEEEADETAKEKCGRSVRV